MILNTYWIRGIELPEGGADASEFLSAWHFGQLEGVTMLDPVLGISTVWWLVIYANILLLLSPLVLLFIVFLPNFPILLLRRMCYIPIESIWQSRVHRSISFLRDRTSLIVKFIVFRILYNERSVKLISFNRRRKIIRKHKVAAENFDILPIAEEIAWRKTIVKFESTIYEESYDSLWWFYKIIES